MSSNCVYNVRTRVFNVALCFVRSNICDERRNRVALIDQDSPITLQPHPGERP